MYDTAITGAESESDIRFTTSYGVSNVRILEKIDLVIMARHCIFESCINSTTVTYKYHHIGINIHMHSIHLQSWMIWTAESQNAN